MLEVVKVNSIWNKLNTKYEQYLQNNTKNTITIKGEHIHHSIERTLDNWKKYNDYKMDIINLFLTELPVSYKLSLSPYIKHDKDKRGYSIKPKYSRGEDLIITLSKLD